MITQVNATLYPSPTGTMTLIGPQSMFVAAGAKVYPLVDIRALWSNPLQSWVLHWKESDGTPCTHTPADGDFFVPTGSGMYLSDTRLEVTWLTAGQPYQTFWGMLVTPP